MKRIPLYDETAPIACTLSDDEIPARLELFGRLRTELRGLDRTEHGLLLRFPSRPDLAAVLRGFAVDEKRCCSFWGFEVIDDGGDLALRWDGPPAAAEILDRLAAFFTGDGDLAPDLAGLL